MRDMSVFLAILLAATAWGAEVKVWEGRLPLPAYEEGPPDINPPFDVFSPRFFNYPYANRDQLTDRKRIRRWRALFLENEYLKCSVLPDLGGHLYSCTDKINGAEMFYANPSIKKAKISYRGAWAAFGIEFNFPVSHNWVSLSPVDFAWWRNPDGSASVMVANVDRPYGMQWRVELRLKPGSTVLEQRVALYNPGDQPHRYYWWNNAGVEVWEDSRIHYPMRYTASHGFRSVDTWPVNSAGLDLSVLKNHTSGNVSLFSHGSREPFMGVYHPRTKAGVVHWAEYADLPGKKIWSWGWNEAAHEWARALSDNESHYVEVQAGLYRNQETYAFLEPQQTIRFTEYWMPVRDIGGVTRANLHGVVHLERKGGALKSGLNVNYAIAGARLRLMQRGKAVWETRESLTPAKPFLKEAQCAAPCTFELADATGRVLLSHTEGKFDFTPDGEVRPGRQPAVHRENDALEHGTDLELNGRLLAAWDVYRKALARAPDHFGLNRAAGRLAVTLKRYREAVEHLSRAQQRVSNDPEVHYFLGNAYAALGDNRRAREEWEGAQRQAPFLAAARFALARLTAREGDPAAALEWIARALSENPLMVRAGGVQVALLRRLGRTAEARERLKYWLAIDPTWVVLRNESVLAGAPREPLWKHLAADPERVLNAASDYMEIGAWDDALRLLERQYPRVDDQEMEPGAVLPQFHPEVAYYRGYCREKMGGSGAADFDAASRLSTQYIFPNRAASFPVLRAAIDRNPKDATARFLLGSLYLSGGMVEEAVAEWEQARKLNPGIPVLHRNLGRTLFAVKREDERALEILREGIRYDPRNPEVYSVAAQALAILRRPAAERAALFERYPDRAAMPAPVAQEFALSLAEAGRHEEAETVFRNRFFAFEEHGTDVRQVWIEVRLLRALGLAKAGKQADARAALEAIGQSAPGIEFTRQGLSQFLRGARFEWRAGQILAACGDRQAAAERWKRAAGMRGPYAAAAARELGQEGWRKRAESELSQSERPLDRALYLLVLERKEEAAALLREVLRAPDRDLAHAQARHALSHGSP